MAYQDFLNLLASAHGIESVEKLLTDHASQYSFQITSRDRARSAIGLLQTKAGIDFAGKRVLDVGCAYGSYTIELTHMGAEAVGVDISDKWLAMAVENAKNETNTKFFNCDASSYRSRKILGEHGPFDIFIVNDVFEHVFDTAGLLSNLAAMGSNNALIYFKIPNGLATRHVLSEGHKKIFGISLLAPDYWSAFTPAPFHIYYRRWDYFEALFKQYGFSSIERLNAVTDENEEFTKRAIANDLNKIRRTLKVENFSGATQFAYVKNAFSYYNDEVSEDLENLSWDALFRKYRETFWHGTVQREPA